MNKTIDLCSPNSSFITICPKIFSLWSERSTNISFNFPFKLIVCVCMRWYERNFLTLPSKKIQCCNTHSHYFILFELERALLIVFLLFFSFVRMFYFGVLYVFLLPKSRIRWRNCFIVLLPKHYISYLCDAQHIFDYIRKYVVVQVPDKVWTVNFSI